MLTRDKAIELRELLRNAPEHLVEAVESPDACIIVRIGGQPALVIQNVDKYMDLMIRAERHRKNYILEPEIEQRVSDVWNENFESLQEYPGEVVDTDLLELREALITKQRFDILMQDGEVPEEPKKAERS